MDYLKENKRYYNSFLSKYKRIKDELSLNEQALLLEKLSNFAWRNFPGILSDQYIENELSRIGRSIKTPSTLTKQTSNNSRLKILHIASALVGIGGHTRVLLNWLKQDQNNSHVLLTRQKSELSENVKDHLNKDCESVTVINANKTVLEKAQSLRNEVLNNEYDVIVLHIDPDDVIPSLALSFENRPKIFFYNHADHVFSVGVSLADIVLDFRDKGKEFSLLRRNAKASIVLPYPLNPLEEVNKTVVNNLKKKLGIEKYKSILLTMASAYKYKPIGQDNFFKFYTDFLKEHNDVVLIVIGVTLKKYKKFCGAPPPANMILTGVVENPKEYLACADYFVEPYPFGTGLGLIDCCRYGAFPIFNYIEYSIYKDSVYGMFPSNFEACKSYSAKEYHDLITDELSSNIRQNQLKSFLTNFLSTGEAPKWIGNVNQLYSQQHYSEYNIDSLPGTGSIDIEQEKKAARMITQSIKIRSRILNGLITQINRAFFYIKIMSILSKINRVAFFNNIFRIYR